MSLDSNLKELVKANNDLTKRLCIERLLSRRGILASGTTITCTISGIDENITMKMVNKVTGDLLLELSMKDVPIELWPSKWRRTYPRIPSLYARIRMLEGDY